MKFIFILFFILFSKSIFANEENNNEVEVINLYESKSLDQMVLDNLNEEEIIEEEVENSNENVEIANNEVEVKQIDTVKLNFIQKNELKNLNNYLNNLKKINTQTLQKEIIEVLENLQLNFELEKDREIFF